MNAFVLSFVVLCIIFAVSFGQEAKAVAPAVAADADTKRSSLFGCVVSPKVARFARSDKFQGFVTKMLNHACDKSEHVANSTICHEKIPQIMTRLNLIKSIALTCDVKVSAADLVPSKKNKKNVALNKDNSLSLSYGYGGGGGSDDSNCASGCTSSYDCIESAGSTFSECSAAIAEDGLNPEADLSCFEAGESFFESSQSCCDCLVYYDLLSCSDCNF